MVQNLVLNNSDHNFAVKVDATRAAMDQTTVQGNPGSAAAVRKNDLSQLESGALTAHGQGLNIDSSG
jgi:hypothetical protein